ncbi:MltR family transcriptional regulator [[Haemophilus] felis]|nr:MltR family transcriptional regulator [[Haemophilus] felis]
MQAQNQFIDQLSEIATVRGFLALSTQQFAHYIELLIENVFRKKDFALKSVVDSLFEHQGPLAELPVRLKLLLGLGVISMDVYQDINHFIEFKLKLSDEVEEPDFSSPIVINFLQSLHFSDSSLVNNLLKQKLSMDKDSMIFQMQQLRLEKVVRSSLILGISQIFDQLEQAST